jgi:hypothetical protein
MSDYIKQLERDNEALSSSVEILAKELEEAKAKIEGLITAKRYFGNLQQKWEREIDDTVLTDILIDYEKMKKIGGV